jgi:hypothetical protein
VGGNYQGQVVGEIIKVKWWGYQGQLVGEIIKVKWWGYLGQVVGISRPSGGDIKVRGRGLEVKVKKKWWGVRALSNSLYYSSQIEVKEDEGGGINSYKSYGLAGGKWMTCFVFVLFILVQLLSNIVDGLVTLWVNFHQHSSNLCPQLYSFFYR